MAFTVVTTIGYGIINPITPAGQLFLVFYGLVGIPMAGVAVSFIAERLLHGAALLCVMVRSGPRKRAFQAFDRGSQWHA